MTILNHEIKVVQNAIGIVTEQAFYVTQRILMQFRESRLRVVLIREYCGKEFFTKEWSF